MSNDSDCSTSSSEIELIQTEPSPQALPKDEGSAQCCTGVPAVRELKSLRCLPELSLDRAVVFPAPYTVDTRGSLYGY